MSRSPCPLSTRSEGKTLPALAAVGDGVTSPVTPSVFPFGKGAKAPGSKGDSGAVMLLKATASGEWPRLVELNGSAPFDTWLGWTAGHGEANFALLSVSRGTRVCVVARELQVAVLNRSDRENDVSVCVSDQFAPTVNTWEFQGDGTHDKTAVPPFAQTVDARSALAGSAAVVELVNGFGTVVSRFPMNGGPHPVGAADALVVTGLAVGEVFRLAFGLGL